MKHTKFVLNVSENKNIKTKSNNLLHGSVGKRSNHFMILGFVDCSPTTWHKKNRLPRLKFVCENLDRATLCILYVVVRNVICINLQLKRRKYFNQTFIIYEIVCMCADRRPQIATNETFPRFPRLLECAFHFIIWRFVDGSGRTHTTIHFSNLIKLS